MLAARLNKLKAATSSVFINSLIGGVLSYCVGNFILANIKSLSFWERDAFRNSFIDLFGEALFFLIIASILYYSIIYFIRKNIKLPIKVGIAALLGAGAYFGFNDIIMSFDFTNYGMVCELIIITLSAADIPFLEEKILHWHS